jgi:hypothetical protein
MEPFHQNSVERIQNMLTEAARQTQYIDSGRLLDVFVKVKECMEFIQISVGESSGRHSSQVMRSTSMSSPQFSSTSTSQSFSKSGRDVGMGVGGRNHREGGGVSIGMGGFGGGEDHDRHTHARSPFASRSVTADFSSPKMIQRTLAKHLATSSILNPSSRAAANGSPDSPVLTRRPFLESPRRSLADQEDSSGGSEADNEEMDRPVYRYTDNKITEDERKRFQHDIQNSPIPLNHKRKQPTPTNMKNDQTLPDTFSAYPPDSIAITSSFQRLIELAQCPSNDYDSEGPSTPKPKYLVPLQSGGRVNQTPSRDDSSAGIEIADVDEAGNVMDQATLKAMLTQCQQRILGADSRFLESGDIVRALATCVSGVEAAAFLNRASPSTSPMEQQFRRLLTSDNIFKRRKTSDPNVDEHHGE